MADNKRPEAMQRITTPVLAQAFIDEQIAALKEGGVDAIAVETSSDPQEAAQAVKAAKSLGMFVAVTEYWPAALTVVLGLWSPLLHTHCAMPSPATVNAVDWP